MSTGKLTEALSCKVFWGAWFCRRGMWASLRGNQGPTESRWGTGGWHSGGQAMQHSGTCGRLAPLNPTFCPKGLGGPGGCGLLAGPGLYS